MKTLLVVMTLGRVLTVFLIMSLPFIIEVLYETKKEKLKIIISHGWTMLIRGVVMVILSLIVYAMKYSHSVIEPLILSIAIHFAFFNYTYNYLTRNVGNRKHKWNYLRDEGIDKFLKGWPIQAILFVQVFLLCFSIYILVHGLVNVIRGDFY